MANKTRNLYSLFLIIFLLFAQVTYAQKNTGSLAKADSLFQKQQYPASFKIYQKILDSARQYSPQMLLKMAYMQEAQHNYMSTLYYLHLYYAKTSDRNVLEKIETLANRQNYDGYAYNDLEIFRTLLDKYYLDILQGLLMLAVMVVTILIRNKRRNKVPNEAFQLFFIFYLVFISFYINMFDVTKKGIIWQNNVAIMAAPSAGASWLATASEGHKIILRGERDIWYETEWKGQKAFIRKKNVLPLP